MIEINLLPKDYRKGSGGLQLGKIGVYTMVGVAGIIVVLIGLTFYQMHQLSQLESNIERANQRAAMLRSDIRVVDALTDVKEKIHRRMTAVERLDRHRSVWVRILEDMARNVPEFVWLGSFRESPVEPPPETDSTQTEETPTTMAQVRPVQVRGYAFSLNALAAFMIKMMRSDYFDDVELVDSRDTLFVEQKAYAFQLSANVHYLSDEEMRALIAAAEEPSAAEPSHKSLN